MYLHFHVTTNPYIVIKYANQTLSYNYVIPYDLPVVMTLGPWAFGFGLAAFFAEVIPFTSNPTHVILATQQNLGNNTYYDNSVKT